MKKNIVKLCSGIHFSLRCINLDFIHFLDLYGTHGVRYVAWRLVSSPQVILVPLSNCHLFIITDTFSFFPPLAATKSFIQHVRETMADRDDYVSTPLTPISTLTKNASFGFRWIAPLSAFPLFRRAYKSARRYISFHRRHLSGADAPSLPLE